MKRMWKGSMVGAMCLVMMMSGLMPAAATELPADTATEAPAPGEETPGTEEGTAPEGESESETEEETEVPVTDPASDALKALTEVMPDGVMVGTLDVSGLSGEEIPLSARIMAVADVFDALVSSRVYKDAFPFEKAMDIIKKDSGSHFDPKVAEAFIAASDEVKTASEHFDKNKLNNYIEMSE